MRFPSLVFFQHILLTLLEQISSRDRLQLAIMRMSNYPLCIRDLKLYLRICYHLHQLSMQTFQLQALHNPFLNQNHLILKRSSSGDNRSKTVKLLLIVKLKNAYRILSQSHYNIV